MPMCSSRKMKSSPGFLLLRRMVLALPFAFRNPGMKSKDRQSSSPIPRNRSFSPICRATVFRHCSHPQRRGLLLAEPRVRTVWHQGCHGSGAVVRLGRPVRSRRLRLADVDGSGVIDIIYLAPEEFESISTNPATALDSTPAVSPNFPPVNDVAKVQALDLLGNGTACLVWTSALPGDVRPSMRYVDLMGGEKPYL